MTAIGLKQTGTRLKTKLEGAEVVADQHFCFRGVKHMTQSVGFICGDNPQSVEARKEGVYLRNRRKEAQCLIILSRM